MWRRPNSRELIPSQVVAVATIGLFGLQGTRVDPRRPPPTARSPLPAVCLVVPAAIPLVPSVDQHPLPPVGQELSGALARRRATLTARVLPSEAASLGPSWRVVGACVASLKASVAARWSMRRRWTTADGNSSLLAVLGRRSCWRFDPRRSCVGSSEFVTLRSWREQRLRVKAATPRCQVFSQPTTAPVLLFSQRSQ